jgi:hypothetical protein
MSPNGASRCSSSRDVPAEPFEIFLVDTAWFTFGQRFRCLTAGYAVLRNFSGVMNHDETSSACWQVLALEFWRLR